jgi:hypothetical protein
MKIRKVRGQRVLGYSSLKAERFAIHAELDRKYAE